MGRISDVEHLLLYILSTNSGYLPTGLSGLKLISYQGAKLPCFVDTYGKGFTYYIRPHFGGVFEEEMIRFKVHISNGVNLGLEEHINKV